MGAVFAEPKHDGWSFLHVVVPFFGGPAPLHERQWALGLQQRTPISFHLAPERSVSVRVEFLNIDTHSGFSLSLRLHPSNTVAVTLIVGDGVGAAVVGACVGACVRPGGRRSAFEYIMIRLLPRSATNSSPVRPRVMPAASCN